MTAQLYRIRRLLSWITVDDEGVQRAVREKLTEMLGPLPIDLGTGTLGSFVEALVKSDSAALSRLLAAFPEMTEDERAEQRRSFVFGNVSLDNPSVTREMVDEADAALRGEMEVATVIDQAEFTSVEGETLNPLRVVYTNYKGETALRTIIPRGTVRYGTSKWHTEPTWLLLANDVDNEGAEREFALKDFGSVDSLEELKQALQFGFWSASGPANDAEQAEREQSEKESWEEFLSTFRPLAEVPPQAVRPKALRDMTLAELQAKAGCYQSEINYRVLGDPRDSVHIGPDGVTVKRHMGE